MMEGVTFVCWKDAPRGMSSIRCAWNSIHPVRDKVDWWNLVWHKHAIPRFSFILWIVVHEALSTQNKFKCYNVILSNAIYVEVIGKMLITYSLILHSPITFGLIYAPDISFPFVVVLRLELSLDFLI